MKNESGIYPCGHRVLVLPEQVEEVSEGGIVIVTPAQEKLEALAQTYGKVVALGDSCFADQKSQWCKVGDRVAFAKYSGLVNTGKDGKKYRVINDLDIVSIVEKEVK